LKQVHFTGYCYKIPGYELSKHGFNVWGRKKKMSIDSFLSHSSAFSYTILRSNRSQVQTLIFVFSRRIITPCSIRQRINMLWTKAEEIKNPIFLNVKTSRFTVGIINKGLIIPAEDWRPTTFGARVHASEWQIYRIKIGKPTWLFFLTLNPCLESS
jgi:hypothetical protein